MKTIKKEFEVYTFEELSKEAQFKAYKDAYDSDYMEPIIEQMNNELENTFADFCKHYHIKVEYEVNSLDYSFTIKENRNTDNNIFLITRGKKLYNYFKEKYEEVNGYITVYSDNKLTEKIKEYLNNYKTDKDVKDKTFFKVITEALVLFFETWKKSIQYYLSFEHYKEDVISNEIYFFKDGREFIDNF